NYLEDPSRKVWSMVYEGKYKLSDKIKILTGARLDRYKLFGTQKTPRFGLIYEANQSRILKFNYGNGFRSPVVAELSGGNFAAGNSSIKPEEIDSYELTYARRFEKSTYSFTLFTNQWKNGIELNQTTFINVGKKEAKGVEFEYKHQLHERTSLSFNSTYAKSEDKIKQINLTSYPRWSHSLGLNHQPKNSSLNYSLYQRYMSFFDNQPNFVGITGIPLKPFYRIDLSITKKTTDNESWRLTLRNLLNRKNKMPAVFGQSDGVIEQGITFDVAYTKRF
ncbi:TonB-dependent receptor, partial [bacterium]|nr:TonB-dependent receptor [bacterium]